MAIVAKVVCVLVAFMVAAAPTAEAEIQCNDVNLNLVYCLNYLKGGFVLYSDCCTGVKAISAMAQTPQDRQAVCGCLKSFLSSLTGLIVANAAALPGKCGISFPYPISPNADCSKVH